MQINPKAIKNILVVRNDRFGEFLLNIPALRALRETFTEAKIISVVSPSVKELAEGIPFIDEIITWEGAQHGLSERLQLINLLKSKKIDMAIMLNPSREFNLIAFLSGIPLRVGYDRKWGFLLNYRMADKKYLGDRHEVEYNLELVGLVGAKTDDKQLSLAAQDDIIKNLWEEFAFGNSGNLMAVHPWTSDPVKQWPLLYFQELVKRLTLELDVKVVVVGGKEELTKNIKFSGDIYGSLTDLTGRTTLKQLAALLKRCKLLISCDSGPVHLACCVGTPVIAIFRNDIPGKTAKRWGPWGSGHRVIEKNNLSDITVEEVFVETREALKKI